VVVCYIFLKLPKETLKRQKERERERKRERERERERENEAAVRGFLCRTLTLQH
jgi:hypothetical protein